MRNANAFQKIIDKFEGCKPDKIWLDKSSEFYRRSVKSWLQDNDIEMYSPYNERTFVAADRFIKTLKNKIYKYITSISKNVRRTNLDDIVDKCNISRMKPILKLMIKILNLKLVIMKEHRNIKTFLVKVTLQISQKFLFFKKI